MNQINNKQYPPLSIMIKPVSGLCNLKCRYCFYTDEVNKRKSKIIKPISISIMKNIIDKIRDYPNKEAYVVFQGGEPLLIGKKFYKEVFSYSKGLNIHYSIQTNGLLLDKEYCSIFKKNNVLVGLSLDGDYKDNLNRITTDNKNSFSIVYSKLKLLQEEKVEHNCLIVIGNNNVKNIKNIFNFFINNNERYLQFIPCLASNNKQYAMDSKSYGDYLINLFDCYYSSYLKGEFVSIRNMDNYLNLVNGRSAEQCGMNGRCSLQYVIEANGDIYPCDFYCLDNYLVGNISNFEFANYLNNKTLMDFLKKEATPDKCKKCEYYKLCKGGCKRENLDFDRCPGTKRFFKHSLNKLDIMYK